MSIRSGIRRVGSAIAEGACQSRGTWDAYRFAARRLARPLGDLYVQNYKAGRTIEDINQRLAEGSLRTKDKSVFAGAISDLTKGLAGMRNAEARSTKAHKLSTYILTSDLSKSEKNLLLQGLLGEVRPIECFVTKITCMGEIAHDMARVGLRDEALDVFVGIIRLLAKHEDRDCSESLTRGLALVMRRAGFTAT